MADAQQSISQRQQQSMNIMPACPVCGNSCSDAPLYRYTASESAAHFCPRSRNADRNRRLHDCIRRLWGREECFILRCCECGFAFGYPFVGGDEEFYSILHEQKGYPAWRWDFDFAIQHALSAFRSGRILDVGAGVGNFLKSVGPAWHSFAVEASESNRQELTEAGIHVFDDLSTAELTQTNSIEIITLFQVLEHIAEFKLVLAQCRRLLCPRGLLVITVPDGDAMIRQECLTGCADMPPNHVNKFTPASLSLALVEAGFSPSPAYNEPSSWRRIPAALHLTVMAKANNERSLAAQIYRISNKRLRQLGLALLAAPTLFSMLPRIDELRAGGAFAMVANRT
jgi:2-polyprenyl-3-methyl-5-hydroxy-6-metoxy-1,4-benzoquinol methylase